MAKKWSQNVMNNSNALDLEKGLFTWKDPKKIAFSLKHSAEQSKKTQGECISIHNVDAEFLY